MRGENSDVFVSMVIYKIIINNFLDAPCSVSQSNWCCVQEIVAVVMHNATGQTISEN